MSEAIDNSVKNLRSKTQSIQFCMLTTFKEDATLISRPMTQQALDDDGTMWFFTSDECEVARDICLNPQINVSFSEPSDKIYVSISGKAALVKDEIKIQQLWNPMVAVWFPKGIDDPHLVLIKFKIDSAEYWDSSDNKMRHLFSLAKAAVTGEQPKEIGEHAKIEF